MYTHKEGCLYNGHWFIPTLKFSINNHHRTSLLYIGDLGAEFVHSIFVVCVCLLNLL